MLRQEWKKAWKTTTTDSKEKAFKPSQIGDKHAESEKEDEESNPSDDEPTTAKAKGKGKPAAKGKAKAKASSEKRALRAKQDFTLATSAAENLVRAIKHDDAYKVAKERNRDADLKTAIETVSTKAGTELLCTDVKELKSNLSAVMFAKLCEDFANCVDAELPALKATIAKVKDERRIEMKYASQTQ